MAGGGRSHHHQLSGLPFFSADRGGVRLVLRVTPGAARSGIFGPVDIGDDRTALAVKVAAPPVEGAANEALLGGRLVGGMLVGGTVDGGTVDGGMLTGGPLIAAAVGVSVGDAIGGIVTGGALIVGALPGGDSSDENGRGFFVVVSLNGGSRVPGARTRAPAPGRRRMRSTRSVDEASSASIKIPAPASRPGGTRSAG